MTTSQVLHLASGDVRAEELRAAPDMGGRIEAVREALIDGPLPIGPDASMWEQVRGRWLADRYALDPGGVAAEQRRLSGLIDDATRADELVLWFDDDLYCMRTLLMVVHRFAVQGPHSNCIVRLGASGGQVVSDRWLDRAADAWHVIARQDAAEIARLGAALAEDDEPLLPRAMQLELRWRVLRVRSREVIAAWVGERATSVTFDEAWQWWRAQHTDLGLGDWQFWLLLAAAAQRGAIALDGAAPTPDSLHDGSYQKAVIRAV